MYRYASEAVAFAALRDAAATVLVGLPTTARDDTQLLQQALMRKSRCSSYDGEEYEGEGGGLSGRDGAAGGGGGGGGGGDGSLREWGEEEGAEETGARDPVALASDPSLTLPPGSPSPVIQHIDLDSNAYLALTWRLAYKRAVQAAYKSAAARVAEAEAVGNPQPVITPARGPGGFLGAGGPNVATPKLRR